MPLAGCFSFGHRTGIVARSYPPSQYENIKSVEKPQFEQFQASLHQA
jgi:hypothetical protein